MTRRRKRPRSLWTEFLRGIRNGADDQDDDDDDDDDGYDPFRYAPEPPFRKGSHPRHTRAIWRFVRCKGKR